MRDLQPVLVGVGLASRVRPDQRLTSPLDLIAEASRTAIADAGAERDLAACIDTIACVRLFADSASWFASPFGGSTKPPLSLAARIGARPARAIHSAVGGNIPQKLINECAQAISEGECELALIAGGEALRTTALALRQGRELDWREDPPGDCEDHGFGEPLATAHELAHGIGIPVQTYPLFEHALRARRRRTVAEHVAAMGRLFAPFTRVAAEHPHASFPTVRTAEELATVSPENRWIAHPYPKWLNAQDKVDQAAAVLVASGHVARELGIPQRQRVYLHGCADVNEQLFVGTRRDLSRSPAIRIAGEHALQMAGVGLGSIDLIDLYSCFPSAVEIACEELGIAEDDPRGLTVTGGLPYFGGPGNAYSLCAIATIVDRLRRSPGTFGLVTANGGYLSKHSIGIYSAKRPGVPFERAPPALDQREVEALPLAELVERASGCGRIETYTVVFGRDGPERGIVVGRLVSGARFIANTPENRPDLLERLLERDPLGLEGRVETRDGRNVFTPT